VINDLNNGKGARILIVDACRDNEALTRFAGSLPRTRSMAFTKGLADESAEGVLIAYATQPGKVAVDEVGGRNSPFTAAILKHIKAPDTDIRVMFTRVRKDVLEATDFSQRPEVSDSMVGEFQFARAAPKDGAANSKLLHSPPIGGRKLIYIQIKSFEDRSNAEAYVKSSTIPVSAFLANNGWFAITLRTTLGEAEAREMAQKMKASNQIPADSFVTYGNTYVEKVCCE
jgi:uncharacterized caspase-like protein